MATEQTARASRAPNAKRAPRRHHWTEPRPRVAPLAAARSHVDFALKLLFPWNRFEYLGFQKCCVQLFQERVGSEAIEIWCRGQRLMPQWAREILLDTLRQRAGDIAKAIAALENEEARR